MEIDPAEGQVQGAQGPAQPAQQTEPTMRELMQMIQELRAENLVLRGRQDQATGPSPARDPTTKVKVPKPDLYHGERTKTQSFLMQLEDYLHFAKGQFGNDADKVRYASTFLRGAAEKWFRPYKRETQEKPQWQWSPQTQAIFSDYRTFAKQLQEAFSAIDEAKRANQILFRIQQKKSVLDYTAEFQEAAYVAGEHSDYTLRQLYYRGLKDEIKEAMSYHDEPESLPELIRLATDMDRRRTNRWFEKKGGYQANMTKPRRERTTLEGGDAMALDAANRQDDKKGNKGRNNNKRPKGPNPNWTDEQKQRYKDRLCITCGSDKHFSPKCPQNPRNKKEGKQTSSAQREASVASRQDNHDMLHWTACYNDDCQTHQSSKDISGWYPHEPRQFGMMTRNEEVIETDEIIDSFPLDEELVNSETGELYESTTESGDSVQSGDPPMLSDKWDTLISLEVLAERYGISKHLHDEWGNLRTIWIPHQRSLALTVLWEWRQNTLWEIRIEQDGKKYELPVTKNTTLVERHHQGTSAREQADYDSLRELARILCRHGTATIQNRTLQWIPDEKLNMPTFRYQVRRDIVYQRKQLRANKWTNWKQAYLQVNEWEDYMHSEVYGYPKPKN
jgi:hypothetical protein